MSDDASGDLPTAHDGDLTTGAPLLLSGDLPTAHDDGAPLLPPQKPAPKPPPPKKLTRHEKKMQEKRDKEAAIAAKRQRQREEKHAAELAREARERAGLAAEEAYEKGRLQAFALAARSFVCRLSAKEGVVVVREQIRRFDREIEVRRAAAGVVNKALEQVILHGRLVVLNQRELAKQDAVAAHDEADLATHRMLMERQCMKDEDGEGQYREKLRELRAQLSLLGRTSQRRCTYQMISHICFRTPLGRNTMLQLYAVPHPKLTKLAQHVPKAASHVVVPRPDSDCLADPTADFRGRLYNDSLVPSACLPVLVSLSLSLFSPLTDTQVKHLTEMADPSLAVLAQVLAVEVAAATTREAHEAEEDKLRGAGDLSVPLTRRRPGKRRRGRRRDRRRKARGRPAASSSSSSSSSAPSSRVVTRLPKAKQRSVSDSEARSLDDEDEEEGTDESSREDEGGGGE